MPCSQRGSSSRGLRLLPELPALCVPVASLRPAEPQPEGFGLPHLQRSHGHGVATHWNV